MYDTYLLTFLLYSPRREHGRLDAKGSHGLSYKEYIGQSAGHYGFDDLISGRVASTAKSQRCRSQRAVGSIKVRGERADGLTLIPWQNDRYA